MTCNDSLRCGWALTLVRIVLGVLFIAHGGQKLFGWFGGEGYAAFLKWAANYPIPTFLAYLAPYAEFIGGLSLVTGIFAELGALATLCVMLGAMFFVHWPHGFFVQHGGYEYVLSLALFDLAIIIGGPGKLALWRPCSRMCKI